MESVRQTVTHELSPGRFKSQYQWRVHINILSTGKLLRKKNIFLFIAIDLGLSTRNISMVKNFFSWAILTDMLINLNVEHLKT